MHVDRTLVDRKLIAIRFRDSYHEKPLVEESCDLGRVVLAHPWPCTGGMLRWNAAF